MSKYIKVRLTGDHPHTGETGRIKIEEDDTVKLNWLNMALVELDDCPHLVDSCFATKDKLVRLGVIEE